MSGLDGRRIGRVVAAVLIATAVIAASLVTMGPVSPVLAHENQTQRFHDGICEWYGQQAWIGYYGSSGTAKGTTSLQDGDCTMVRVKLRYKNNSQQCVLTIETGIVAHQILRNGYHVDYSDADVLLSPTWYGFRVNHSGSC